MEQTELKTRKAASQAGLLQRTDMQKVAAPGRRSDMPESNLDFEMSCIAVSQCYLPAKNSSTASGFGSRPHFTGA
ncbi:hypothetical protein PG993_010128 [Apiospora rasikravindrae]|uniref:Uncharacterized protein n=1 Tax=Apiospora rasikravindrae TaxID=990691 RepID=A0ABR1SNN9_9PEZI